jgi:hypothetical protein
MRYHHLIREKRHSIAAHSCIGIASAGIATNGMRYSTAQDREILDVLNPAAQG